MPIPGRRPLAMSVHGEEARTPLAGEVFPTDAVARRRVARPWSGSWSPPRARAGPRFGIRSPCRRGAPRKGHAVAPARDPPDPYDVYTAFVRELAAIPDCSALCEPAAGGAPRRPTRVVHPRQPCPPLGTSSLPDPAPGGPGRINRTARLTVDRHRASRDRNSYRGAMARCQPKTVCVHLARTRRRCPAQDGGLDQSSCVNTHSGTGRGGSAYRGPPGQACGYDP